MKKYDVSLTSDLRDEFYQSVRRYWPSIERDRLAPSFCGVRPKIKFGETTFPDFAVMTEDQHTIKGLVNLFGIESPGLTSCLSIARSVVDGLLLTAN